MNKKIAILADSASSLSQKDLSKSTYMTHFYIHLENKSYKDMLEISPDEVYGKMKQGLIAKTSIPSIGDIKEIISQIKKDGYSEILAICVSSGLSGMYNAISIVAEELDIRMKVIDTKNVSLGCGLFTIYAQDLLEKNPDITLDELYETVSSKASYTKTFMFLNTLKYLVAGGRIGKVAGSLGNLLKILPIITCDNDGTYTRISKVRSSDKAISEICKKIKNFISKNANKNHYIAVVYKRDDLTLKKIEKSLKEEISSAIKYIKYDIVTPVIGVHSGEEAIGIATLCF